MIDAAWMACPECDLLHRMERLPRGETALCGRCGAFLRRGTATVLDTPLAIVSVALLLYVAANAFPLLEIQLHGTVQLASIPDCVGALVSLGWPWLAAILITTVVVAPPAYLGGLAYVLVQARRRRATRRTMRIFRIIQEFQPWGMAGVFLLGVLVSYVKLKDMAEVSPGPSIYALAGLVVTTAALATALEPAAVWDVLERGS